MLSVYAIAQLGAAVAGWVEFSAEQSQHAQQASLLGSDGYLWTLLEQTLQNWQSEFLALATLVVLTAVLVHRGSRHSKDGQEEIDRRVRAIQRRVTALAAEAHR
jgi:hypothetical protein